MRGGRREGPGEDVVLRTAPPGPCGRSGGPVGPRGRSRPGGGAPAGAAASARHFTRPYQTLLVQIFWSRTTSPVFGACQILFLPA